MLDNPVTDKETKLIMNALRRFSYRWWPRTVVMRAARVSRGVYECAICGSHVPRKMVQLDHIKPVINPRTGFVDFNTFVSRLFVGEKGWQVACKPCHKDKSNKENIKRRKNK